MQRKSSDTWITQIGAKLHARNQVITAVLAAIRDRLPFGGRLRVDHGLAAREAVVAGRGIAPAHQWLVDDLLAAGRLEVILPDYALPSVPLSLLIVPERAGIARVRLLIDFLVEQIGAIPGIENPQSGD